MQNTLVGWIWTELGLRQSSCPPIVAGVHLHGRSVCYISIPQPLHAQAEVLLLVENNCTCTRLFQGRALHLGQISVPKTSMYGLSVRDDGHKPPTNDAMLVNARASFTRQSAECISFMA